VEGASLEDALGISAWERSEFMSENPSAALSPLQIKRVLGLFKPLTMWA